MYVCGRMYVKLCVCMCMCVYVYACVCVCVVCDNALVLKHLNQPIRQTEIFTDDQWTMHNPKNGFNDSDQEQGYEACNKRQARHGPNAGRKHEGRVKQQTDSGWCHTSRCRNLSLFQQKHFLSIKGIQAMRIRQRNRTLFYAAVTNEAGRH